MPKKHRIYGKGLWDDVKSYAHKAHNYLQKVRPASWVLDNVPHLVDQVPYARTLLTGAINVLGYKRRTRKVTYRKKR